jgi:hypothetical protein
MITVKMHKEDNAGKRYNEAQQEFPTLQEAYNWLTSNQKTHRPFFAIKEEMQTSGSSYFLGVEDCTFITVYNQNQVGTK